MDTTQIVALVSLILALSIASERLVEIVKGLVSWLNLENSDARQEGWRRSVLQLLAVASGILTAFLARNAIPTGLLPSGVAGAWSVVALGLLASGGSGFWNSILSYMAHVKEIKKVDALDRQMEFSTKQAAFVTAEAVPEMDEASAPARMAAPDPAGFAG
jgi:hypothetical protein